MSRTGAQRTRSVMAACSGGALAFAMAAATQAATFTVNSTADAVDLNPGNGVCETGASNGICTLRAAVMEADALGGTNSIVVPAGTYLLTAGLGRIATTNATNSLTITGTGAAGTVVVDGQAAIGVLQLSGGTVGVSNLVVRNGNQVISGGSAGACTGGGIMVLGATTVNLTSSAVQGNTVVNGTGGGMCILSGTVNLDRTTVSGNFASLGGGGIRIQTGTLNVTNSTLSGNSVDNTGFGNGGCGGAIESQATVSVTNSTISGNTVAALGAFAGAICTFGNSAVTNLLNSTVAFNTGAVGQLEAQSGAVVNLTSTIVANPVTGTNCAGTTFVSAGHNLVDDNSCGLAGTGDLGGSPLLAALANNGGPTLTHALGTGSPAIDAGANPGNLSTDQRGAGFLRVVGSAADVGAFEFAPSVVIPLQPVPTPTLGQWALLLLAALLGGAGAARMRRRG